jgi:hypothetical protein
LPDSWIFGRGSEPAFREGLDVDGAEDAPRPRLDARKVTLTRELRDPTRRDPKALRDVARRQQTGCVLMGSYL